jgi:hypothetical protein
MKEPPQESGTFLMNMVGRNVEQNKVHFRENSTEKAQNIDFSLDRRFRMAPPLPRAALAAREWSPASQRSGGSGSYFTP